MVFLADQQHSQTSSQTTRRRIYTPVKMVQVPNIKLNSGHDMPQVGFGLWKVDNAIAADTVYNAIKLGYRLFDGACGESGVFPPISSFLPRSGPSEAAIAWTHGTLGKGKAADKLGRATRFATHLDGGASARLKFIYPAPCSLPLPPLGRPGTRRGLDPVRQAVVGWSGHSKCRDLS
jgi:hypothetical protein